MPRYLAFLAAACMLGCTAPTLTPETVAGDWGSREVSLTLSARGGTLSYQCGAGTIDPGWQLDERGIFAGTGQHFFGGGPAPIEGRPPQSAQYLGRFQGNRLTLSVVLSDPKQTLGPFLLTRGATVVGPVCL